jgi:hypothetical protein
LAFGFSDSHLFLTNFARTSSILNRRQSMHILHLACTPRCIGFI